MSDNILMLLNENTDAGSGSLPASSVSSTSTSTSTSTSKSRNCYRDTTTTTTKPITIALKTTLGSINHNNRHKQRIMLSFLCLVLLLYAAYIQGALSIANMRIAQLEQQQQQQQQQGGESESVSVSVRMQAATQKIEENRKIHANAPTPTMEFDYIPLIDLVNTHTQNHPNITCPEGLKPINQVVDWEAEHNGTRKIPKIIHMTGKTVCLTDPFYKNAQSWQLQGYSFYFHDDQAVQRLLLNKYWKEFPLLQYAWPCYGKKGGATFADIWRYLLVRMIHDDT